SDTGVAMLPQPFVTVAQGKVQGLRVALDLTAEWDALDNGSQFLTGVLVVRKAFAEENPAHLAKFLEEYEASTEWINANPADGAKLVEANGIVAATVAEKAIPYCNIVCLHGEEMKGSAAGYLQTLYDQNPKAVGGKLPGDDFYFISK
ncbi:MAG: ABC transporter substrate-binding protein, partial [Firmicutes bacterium]|nr:ABC transporter substrate-binding protein [Bacillota bacterium]